MEKRERTRKTKANKTLSRERPSKRNEAIVEADVIDKQDF